MTVISPTNTPTHPFVILQSVNELEFHTECNPLTLCRCINRKAGWLVEMVETNLFLPTTLTHVVCAYL